MSVVLRPLLWVSQLAASLSHVTARLACSSADLTTFSALMTCTRLSMKSLFSVLKARELTMFYPATLRTCSAAAPWLYLMTEST